MVAQMAVDLKLSRADLAVQETQSDLGALFRFEDTQTGFEALVSLATLLQCLCVSRNACLVPELPVEWKNVALPEGIEAMSADCGTTVEKDGSKI